MQFMEVMHSVLALSSSKECYTQSTEPITCGHNYMKTNKLIGNK
jgi:hypothetical protein